MMQWAEAMPGTKVVRSFEDRTDALRLTVAQAGNRVKIELSPVLRGSVFPPELREFSPRARESFGDLDVQLLSLPDLYAGKICAALDRQHPRDLFDVKLLRENEGLTTDLVKTFVVYLISHNRTMGELLRPTRKEIGDLYQKEFLRMTEEEVTLGALLEARERLVVSLNKALIDQSRTSRTQNSPMALNPELYPDTS